MDHRPHRIPFAAFLFVLPLFAAAFLLSPALHAAVAEDDAWPRRVLITNDNGIEDVATLELARAFARTAEVVLVAPAEDRSGSGSFMTFPTTGRFVVERREVGEGIAAWALDGYPADCVVFALTGPMAEAPPDLVVSGINGGPNLADAWFGSGTIGAARTAAFLGVPALAVSGVEDDDPQAVAAVVDWVLRISRSGIVEEIRPPSYLTISLPVGPPAEITGIEVVDRARGILGASARLEEEASTASAQVWTIELEMRNPPGAETGAAAVARSHIAVMPMRIGDEAPETLEWLRENEDLLPAWHPRPEGSSGDVASIPDDSPFTGAVKPVVYVEDAETSARFYDEVLGFEHLGFSELDGEVYYAELAAGGTKLGLHEPTSEGDAERVGRLKLYFRLRDLDSHRERIAAQGGEPGPVRETAYMDMFAVDDPDGNRIVFGMTDPERHDFDPWVAGGDLED